MGAAMPMGLAATSIGIGREALDTVAATQGQRLERVSPEQLGESSALFARLAEAAGNLDAAFNLLMNDCERLDALEAPEQWTAFDWSRIGFHRAYSARLCREVVNSLFDASGGSGIYETTTIQRLWRDGNAACAHGGFHWDTAAPGFGRQLLGLPPSRFARAGRARAPEPAAL
jgi:3-hydroxy-9,10-secoandrosta-1,3,5(10)-triene-9,17-dione monooxygenase